MFLGRVSVPPLTLVVKRRVIAYAVVLDRLSYLRCNHRRLPPAYASCCRLVCSSCGCDPGETSNPLVVALVRCA
jgi:hypothetical protein